jgi:hypothetical protein
MVAWSHYFGPAARLSIMAESRKQSKTARWPLGGREKQSGEGEREGG